MVDLLVVNYPIVYVVDVEKALNNGVSLIVVVVATHQAVVLAAGPSKGLLVVKEHFLLR